MFGSSLFKVGGIGSAAFDPLTLNPYVWVRGQSLGLSDGTAVGTFTDLSGNSRDFTQSFGASKPTYRTAGPNGMGYLEFDGNDSMTSVAFTANQPDTVFIVAKDSVGSGNRIFVNSAGSRQQVWAAGGVLAAFAGGAAVGTTSLGTGWRIYTVEFNGSSSNAWLELVQEMTNVNVSTSAMSGGTVLGSDGSNFLQGGIAELLIAPGAIGATTGVPYISLLKTLYGL